MYMYVPTDDYNTTILRNGVVGIEGVSVFADTVRIHALANAPSWHINM